MKTKQIVTGTDNGGSEDQKGNNKDKDEEDIVESPDGSVEVSHGSLETQPFSVNTKNSSLDLIPGSVTVSVLVKNLESELGSLEIWEAGDEQRARKMASTHNRATSINLTWSTPGCRYE